MSKRTNVIGTSTRHMIFNEIRYKLERMRKCANDGYMTGVKMYNREIEGFVECLLFTHTIDGYMFHKLNEIRRATNNECFEILKTTLKID